MIAARAAATVLLVTAVLACPPAALAQEEAPPPRMRVTLEAIDGILPGVDGTIAIRVRLDAGRAARDDLRLQLALHTPVADRDGLVVPSETVFSSVSQDLPSMPAGTTRLIDAAATAAELSLEGEGRAGVYPLQVKVFDGVDAVASLLTSVIVLPTEAPPDALLTSVVLRAAIPGVPSAQDVVDPALERAVRPGGGLYDAVASLDDARKGQGGLPGVNLVLEGRGLSDIAAMTDGFAREDGTVVDADRRPARAAAVLLDRVRAAARRADTLTLAMPHGPADLVALVRGGEGGRALALTEIAAQTVADVLGSEVADGVLVPADGLDAATLGAIAPADLDAVLLDAPYVTLADRDAMTPVRLLRTAGGGRVTMLVPDPGLSRMLSDPSDAGPAAVVQQILAETATRWLAGDRHEEIAALLSTSTDDVAEDLLPHLLAGIRRAPWLRPVNLAGLLAGVTPSERLVRLAYPLRARSAELDTAYIADLGLAYDALEPLRALLADADPPAEDPAAQVTADGELGLRSVASIAYRGTDSRAVGHRRIQRVLDQLRRLGGAVEIVTGPPITLTSTTGDVPVTLVNTGGVPLRVRAEVASTGFAFDAGASRELLLAPDEPATVTFRARALNPGGLSAVRVVVEDPAGARTLSTSTIAVRSTAYPVVALVAIVGGSLSLVVWGLREALRRRRKPDDEVTRTPAEVA